MTTASERAPLTPMLLAFSAILIPFFAAFVVARVTVSSTTLIAGGLILTVVGLLHIRLTVYIIIFSMLLSPELGIGASAGSRAVTVRFEDILLILVGFAWLARSAYQKDVGLIRSGPLNWPIAAYTVAAVLATLVSGWLDQINWLRALLFLTKYIEYFVLYFLVLNTVRDRADIRNYLIAAFVTCAIVSIVGIAQIPTNQRVSAPFEGEIGEPNTFGGYLVFMLAITSGFYLMATSIRERVLWLGMGALITLPLLYTLSRSSWLAAGAMGLALMWLSPKKGHLFVAAAIAITLSPVVLPHQVVKRMAYTLEQPAEAGQIKVGKARLDTSLSARIRSWQYGLEGWTARPLTGYGVASYGFMDAQYVRILVETGLIGLAAFGWLMINIFRMARSRLHEVKDRFAVALSLGYLAGFIALLVHGIGANTFIIVRIMEPFWLVTALVVALPQTERASD